MKIRCGFVSNSSSSSFYIPRGNLSNLQVYAIKHHLEVGKDFGIEDILEEDKWSIYLDDHIVRGSTYMDNFEMDKFLKAIGVKDEDIYWGG